MQDDEEDMMLICDLMQLFGEMLSMQDDEEDMMREGVNGRSQQRRQPEPHERRGGKKKLRLSNTQAGYARGQFPRPQHPLPCK
jgi:hypothetical protein